MSDFICDPDDETSVIEHKARWWLAEVTGDEGFKKQDVSLQELLKSGVTLCELLNRIRPGMVPKINSASSMPFLHTQNILNYCNGCRALGLKPSSIFEPLELYNGTNMAAVARNIAQLADLVRGGALSLPPRASAPRTPQLSPSQSARSAGRAAASQPASPLVVHRPRGAASSDRTPVLRSGSPSLSPSPGRRCAADPPPRADVTTSEQDMKIKEELKYNSDLEDAIREWICAVMGDGALFSANVTFIESLRSGVVLCGLINKLKPGAITRIARQSSYAQVENILSFLRVCEMLGVPTSQLFSANDLYEGKNPSRVLDCIYSLAVHAKSRGLTDVAIRDTSKSRTLFSQSLSQEAAPFCADGAQEECAPEHRELCDWANAQLAKSGRAGALALRNLGSDVRSGVKLLRLAECLACEDCFERHYDPPTTLTECMHNACALFTFVEQRKSKQIVCCQPADIVRGSEPRVAAFVAFLREEFDLEYSFLKTLQASLCGAHSPGAEPGAEATDVAALLQRGEITTEDLIAGANAEEGSAALEEEEVEEEVEEEDDDDRATPALSDSASASADEGAGGSKAGSLSDAPSTGKSKKKSKSKSKSKGKSKRAEEDDYGGGDNCTDEKKKKKKKKRHSSSSKRQSSASLDESSAASSESSSPVSSLDGDAEKKTRQRKGHGRSSKHTVHVNGLFSSETKTKDSPSIVVRPPPNSLIDGQGDSESNKSSEETMVNNQSNSTTTTTTAKAPINKFISVVHAVNAGSIWKRATLERRNSIINSEEAKKIRDAQLAMRLRIVTELKTTEESYVRSLCTLCDKVVAPLLREAEHPSAPVVSHSASPLSAADVAGLFANVEEIRRDHEAFLGKIEARFAAWDQERSTVADLLLAQLPQFRHYAPYLQGYAASAAAYYFIYERNERLRALVDRFEAEQYAVNKLNVPSFLVMPVQRLPRYIMLMKDLRKYTPPGHPDTPLLADLAEQLPAALAEMNRQIDPGRAGNMQRNVSIGKIITGDGVDLVARGERHFVCEAEPKRVAVEPVQLEHVRRRPGAARKGHVYVFDTLLLVCASTGKLDAPYALLSVAEMHSISSIITAEKTVRYTFFENGAPATPETVDVALGGSSPLPQTNVFLTFASVEEAKMFGNQISSLLSTALLALP